MREILLILWFLAAAGGVGRAGTLRLDFRGPDGRPVDISKAALLLKGWGFAASADLSTSGDSLKVPTDFDWLRAQFPGFDLRPTRHVQFRLLFEARGFATLQSQDFFWPGSTDGEAGASRSVVIVRFPNGQSFEMEPGAETTVAIRFRRAGLRRIRLIDEQGRPVPGVTVKVSRHWSHDNHCGLLSGGALLVESPSDSTGFVQIPDGDFEYAILVPDWSEVLLAERNCCDQAGWVTYLHRETTDVLVHRFGIQPLRVRVYRGGLPASGISLWGWRRYCDDGTCGACYGVVAVSDRQGRIDVKDFKPETLRELMILKTNDNGPRGENILWKADPTSSSVRSTVRVELPE